MKKMKGSTIAKLVAFFAGIAAVGAACYIFRDKIKEFCEKIELKKKVETAKNFVQDKIGKKKDDYFDDADFFDDEEEDEAESDSVERGYTSINISGEEKVAEPVQAAEAASAEETTEEVEAYENEGLSDVDEDEDALADEAKLDGAN